MLLNVGCAKHEFKEYPNIQLFKSYEMGYADHAATCTSEYDPTCWTLNGDLTGSNNHLYADVAIEYILNENRITNAIMIIKDAQGRVINTFNTIPQMNGTFGADQINMSLRASNGDEVTVNANFMIPSLRDRIDIRKNSSFNGKNQWQQDTDIALLTVIDPMDYQYYGITQQQ
jgi:hypothetical protein